MPQKIQGLKPKSKPEDVSDVELRRKYPVDADDDLVQQIKDYDTGDDNTKLRRELSGWNDPEDRMRPGLFGKARNPNFGKDTGLPNENKKKVIGLGSQRKK